MQKIDKNHITAIFFLFLFAAGTAFLFFSKDTLADSLIETNTNKKQIEKSQKTEKKNKDSEPKETIKKYTIKEGDTFADAIEELGLQYKDMLNIVSSTKDVYDFTNIKVGQPLSLIKKKNEFDRLEYEINLDEKVIVKNNNGGYTADKKKINYKVSTTTIKGTIGSSLFKTGRNIGMSDQLIMDLAGVFAWNIDFATQVKKGDSFKILYEKKYRNGKFIEAGDILAAKFMNNGEDYSAFLFEDKEGESAYFDKKGKSLVRQFLKAPLRYDRITSGYTNARFHPTLSKNMPHKAIDYAASYGTPIRAVGDGIITYAGWNGGYGRYIDIRHNDTYSTQYAHLSGIAVNNGERVKQGDIVGYVGSTGYSTGPHLHYQIKKYGQKVNPLEVELPAGDPVPEDKRVEFDKVKNEYINEF